MVMLLRATAAIALNWDMTRREGTTRTPTEQREWGGHSVCVGRGVAAVLDQERRVVCVLGRGGCRGGGTCGVGGSKEKGRGVP